MPIYRLPPTFYDDHVSRDLPSGEEVRRTKSHVFVNLTDEERAELLSDARHYASPSMGFSADYPGLVASARATIKALETDLSEVRLQGRTILRPGDLVRIDSGQARYTVQRIVQTSSGVEVHAYGGKPGFLAARVFAPDKVTRCRATRDPNVHYREAIHEASMAAKRRKAGAR